MVILYHKRKKKKDKFKISPDWSTSSKILLRLESTGVTLILSISFLMEFSLSRVSPAEPLAEAAFRLASSITPPMSSELKKDEEEL